MKRLSIALFVLIFPCISGRESVWNALITDETNGNFFVFPNYLYQDSFVSVRMVCESNDENLQINVIWMLVEMNCMQDMYNTQPVKQSSLIPLLGQNAKILDTAPIWQSMYAPKNVNYTTIKFQVSIQKHYKCGDQHIVTLEDESNLPWFIAQVPDGVKQPNSSLVKVWRILRPPVKNGTESIPDRVARTWSTGMYHFMLSVLPLKDKEQFKATVHVEMRSSYGYLSAISWPLLPYSAVTSFMYLILGTIWIIVWTKAQQHTTKIHVVIGIVTVAGGVTNTMVFVEQASVNSTGQGFLGLDWISQILTVIQASLTTMLLMVVSTGHGITRPTLHKNIVIGIVVLASLRFIVSLAVMVVTDERLRVQYKVPIVSFTVSAIYGLVMLIIGAFIMILSILTFIHLWKRKHSQQIIFFSIFMVACILSFVVEIILLAVGYGWLSSCRQDWKHEWIFNNFGSVITVLLLVVLMWLWRPIDVAQSYAFHPLDSVDKDVLVAEEEDDDETELYSKAATNTIPVVYL